MTTLNPLDFSAVWPYNCTVKVKLFERIFLFALYSVIISLNKLRSVIRRICKKSATVTLTLTNSIGAFFIAPNATSRQGVGTTKTALTTTLHGLGECNG